MRSPRRPLIAAALGGAIAATAPAVAADPSFRSVPSPTSFAFTRLAGVHADADGNIDLIGAGTYGSLSTAVFAVLRGRGDGTFTHAATPSDEIGFGDKVSNMVTGDVTGDGRTDAIVSTSQPVAPGGSLIRFFKALPAGGFEFAGTIAGLPGVAGAPGPLLALGDANGDRTLDLAYLDVTSGILTVRRNNGAGTFSPTSLAQLIPGTSGLAMTDLNGDGRADLVATGNLELTTLLADPTTPTGFRGPSTVSTTSSSDSLTVLDMDENGRSDAVVTTLDASVSPPRSGPTLLFSGSGNGAFDPTPSRLDFGPETHLDGRQVDLNGDGFVDLTSTNLFGTLLTILPSTFGGPPAPTAFVATSPFAALAPVDVNADGRMDLVTAGNSVIVSLINTSPYPPPQATTGDALEPTYSSLRLTGTVRTNRQPTTAYFEYGRSTAYGKRTPDITAASTLTAPTTTTITGLGAGDVIHYRLVATNAFGVSRGADRVASSRGIVGSVAFSSRWRSGAQLGRLVIAGLPAKRGTMRVTLRRTGAKRVLLRRTIATSPARTRVLLQLPSTVAPGTYEVAITGPTDTGAITTQTAHLVLTAPREGYAAGFFSRRDGSAPVRTIPYGARVLWVNYRFVADPVTRPKSLIQRCSGPVRFADAARRFKRSLTISMSTNPVTALPRGRYTCTLSIPNGRGPITRVTVRIR